MNKIKITVGLLIACYALGVMGLTVFVETWFVAGKADVTSDTAPAPTPTGVPASSQRTVLPETSKGITDCKFLMNEVSKNACWVQKEIFGKDCTPSGATPAIVVGDTTKNDILACGIKTGSMKMWMIPYYIKYVLEFIIGISGLTSVCGIIYGGYLYLFAGVSQDKDKGKKSIQYGVIGMILTLVAWALVNIIIALVTG